MVRHGQRGPMSLPFCRVPQLLPAGIALLRFREGLAVELLESSPGDLARPRLYAEHSHAGGTRIFLPPGRGAFELGSRGQNCLQRIEYQVSSEGAAAIEIAPHNLRIISAPLPCAAVLWTREPRSGDLHVCCAQLAD
jgi:hypothetical protein